MKKYRYYVGIDTGTNTGFAVWDSNHQKFTEVSCIKIHQAMEKVLNMDAIFYDTLIRVEDARQRKWFGNAGREQLQGAGSIKRDSTIWEDFLTDVGANFELVAPKNNKTKMTSDLFQRITRWDGRTNEHARDAAMLIYGL